MMVQIVDTVLWDKGSGEAVHERILLRGTFQRYDDSDPQPLE